MMRPAGATGLHLSNALRTPFRLLRFRGLLFAVMAASATLAVAGAAAPLFLNSAGGATLEQYMSAGGSTPPAATIIANGLLARDLSDYRDVLLERAAGEVLGPPVRSLVGGQLAITGPRDVEIVQLVSRTGALQNVAIRDQSGAEGVWLSDYTAARAGVSAGEVVRISGPGEDVEVEVAGVYRDLLTAPRRPFWEPFFGLIYPAPTANTRPPALMLVDQPTFFAIGQTVRDDRAEFRWEYPLAKTELTLEEGRSASSRVASFQAELNDPTQQLGAAFDDVNFTSNFFGWVDQAEATVAAIEAPITSLALGGLVIGFVGLGVVGLFEVRRRRVEFNLLNARGVSPLRLGARSTVEALLPVALGSALGWGGAYALVRSLGPDGPIAASALQRGVEGVAWVALAAALLLGAVAGWTARTQAEGNRRFKQVASKTPWELIVLALGAASLYELLTRSAAPVEAAGDGPPEIDRLLMLFPLLFIAGFAGLASRALRLGLGRMRTVGRAWKPAAYLAFRRLSSFSKLVGSLVTASSVAIGILVFAAVLSSSIKTTAGQEAFLFVGSDTAVSLTQPPPRLARAPFASTPVVRIADTSLEPGEASADVLGVVPSSFSAGAHWENGFSAEPLEDLLDRLSAPSGGAELPVIVAGDGSFRDDLLLDDFGVPVRVVGRAEVWPGMVGERPLLVADSAALDRALRAAGSGILQAADAYEVWSHAAPSEVAGALRTEGAEPLGAVTAEEIRATPAYLALTWMFGFLEALGVAAGLVALIATFLFLQSRQREGEAAYALASRMGLPSRSHRSSVALELAGMLACSFAIGTSLAIVAGWFVYGRIDLGTESGRVPLLEVPILFLTGVLLVLGLFAYAGAWSVQRRADRTNVAQVMRYAD